MISIVIPAYNEEKSIANCLDALVTQKTNIPFEVIVVNNRSSDKTREIALSYKNKLNLRIIDEKTKGRGMAREIGFRNARGDIIFSTDADSVVPPNWIQKTNESFSDANIIAVTGNCKIIDIDKTLEFFAVILWTLGWLSMRCILGFWSLSGYNFAVRRSAYLKAEGFNPKLNSNEDTDLGYKLNKIGKIIWACPVVAVSGRRYKIGFIKANTDYIKDFISWKFFKKDTISLSDVR